MSEPTILIVPPQNLSAADKRALIKSGVLVVEMDDPQKARFIRPSTELSSTDLLGAAAEAIQTGNTDHGTRVAFAKAITALLIKAAKKQAQSQPQDEDTLP